MEIPKVELDFRKRAQGSRVATAWRGFSAEYVELPAGTSFSYAWAGPSNYLALHEIRLLDGETRIESQAPVHLLDLNERFTFLPVDCRISGWSSVADSPNNYTALFFDTAILMEETEIYDHSILEIPMLYFRDQALLSTITKIGEALREPSPAQSVYAETLGLLALLELSRLQRRTPVGGFPRSGCLSTHQQRRVGDYIADNIASKLTLDELASLTGLSRFHFSRAFKASFGTPPHQYVLEVRIASAKRLLRQSGISIAAIADLLGFTSAAQFSQVFRRIAGQTPSEFRRS